MIQNTEKSYIKSMDWKMRIYNRSEKLNRYENLLNQDIKMQDKVYKYSFLRYDIKVKNKCEKEYDVTMKKDLTTGNIIKTMLIFAGPMIIGNLLQQFYNIADTLIVGRFVGADAMASVGAAYTLMTFLTSILIGLCMGSGSLVSFYFGKQDKEKMEVCVQGSFLLIGGVTVVINVLVFVFINQILRILQIQAEILEMSH